MKLLKRLIELISPIPPVVTGNYLERRKRYRRLLGMDDGGQ